MNESMKHELAERSFIDLILIKLFNVNRITIPSRIGRFQYYNLGNRKSCFYSNFYC